MMKFPREGLLHPALLTLFLCSGGCDGGASQDQATQSAPGTPAPASAVAPAPTEAAPVADLTQGAGSSPSIKEIMTKLTKGPNSLTPVIGKELQSDEPPWDTIQGQTKEFAQLAAAMSKNDPPKGHKESWEKLTSAYAEWASDLDKAAQTKTKAAALEAHGKLAGSCMACHREHRVMGKGKGGPPGGPGGPGGPPGGGPGEPPPK